METQSRQRTGSRKQKILGKACNLILKICLMKHEGARTNKENYFRPYRSEARKQTEMVSVLVISYWGNPHQHILTGAEVNTTLHSQRCQPLATSSLYLRYTLKDNETKSYFRQLDAANTTEFLTYWPRRLPNRRYALTFSNSSRSASSVHEVLHHQIVCAACITTPTTTAEV